MRLRKRQSWTVVWEPPPLLGPDRHGRGRVKITESATGRVFELLPGETANIDATLELEPTSGGWELLA